MPTGIYCPEDDLLFLRLLDSFLVLEPGIITHRATLRESFAKAEQIAEVLRHQYDFTVVTATFFHVCNRTTNATKTPWPLNLLTDFVQFSLRVGSAQGIADLRAYIRQTTAEQHGPLLKAVEETIWHRSLANSMPLAHHFRLEFGKLLTT